ncbi:MAG TPA: Ig-like domain-containing protein, partial [Longimicrobiaceae bacterium]|nr:Ig-like domain-containing protein [Longimicrobiaceae bacterium]
MLHPVKATSALLLALALGGGCEVATEAAPPVPTQVRIAGDSVHLHVGEGAVLPAAALDAAGNPVEDARLAWSSSDSTVAAVDSAGRVTAVRPGRA